MKVRSQPNAQEMPSAHGAPGAWEYLVVTGSAESAELLTEYGTQGWELVAVIRDVGTRATFYFKRRRQ